MMIKYLCIKDYYDTFEKGKIYQTSFRNDHMAKGYGTYMQKENSIFDIRFDDKELEEHFINLADWRDQQIDSILEDE